MDRSDGNKLQFVKIHAPMEVLRRYSEILKYYPCHAMLDKKEDTFFCIRICFLNVCFTQVVDGLQDCILNIFRIMVAGKSPSKFHSLKTPCDPF